MREKFEMSKNRLHLEEKSVYIPDSEIKCFKFKDIMQEIKRLFSTFIKEKKLELIIKNEVPDDSFIYSD